MPFTPEFSRLLAGDVRARRAGRAPARERGRGGGELPLRAQGGRRRRAADAGSGRTLRLHGRGRAAGRAADDGDGDLLLDLHPGLRRRRRRGGGGRARWAGRTGWRAWSCAATSAAASWASRRPTSRAPPFAAVPADGVYAGCLVPATRARGEPGAAARPRSRSAPTRPSRAASAGSRRTCWTSTATSTASTSASTSSHGCAPMRALRRHRAAGRRRSATDVARRPGPCSVCPDGRLTGADRRAAGCW